MNKEPEFTNEQLQRIDDVHNAVYELCKTLTEKDDLQWDMSYIGEIADVACDILNRNRYGVRYPAIVTDSDSGETMIEEWHNGYFVNDDGIFMKHFNLEDVRDDE